MLYYDLPHCSQDFIQFSPNLIISCRKAPFLWDFLVLEFMLASVEVNQIVKPGFGLSAHFLGRALSNTNNFFFFLKQVCLMIKDAEILHNDGSNHFTISFSAGHISHQWGF